MKINHSYINGLLQKCNLLIFDMTDPLPPKGDINQGVKVMFPLEDLGVMKTFQSGFISALLTAFILFPSCGKNWLEEKPKGQLDEFVLADERVLMHC